MDRAFANVRILDFTRVLAGPFASLQLALQGADVVKIEHPEGEDTRKIARSREWADRQMAPIWMAVNSNKRSLTLDLQKPAAKEIIRRLAREHEVLLTIEEGSIGGFGAFVLHFLAADGLLDRGLKIRTLTLPDIFQDQDKPELMYAAAGLDADAIANAALLALGRGVNEARA